MTLGETVERTLRRVQAALEAARVPYMLTGSLASTYHGVPRTTQDVDIVIAPTGESLDALLRELPADAYYVSRDAAARALRDESFFNVIDNASGWKIDFIVRKSRAFNRVEFDRRREAEVLGMRLFVASAEDVVVAKLEWARRSVSDRQIADVAGILRAQGSTLDSSYVERWVEELELDREWQRARAEAFGPGA